MSAGKTSINISNIDENLDYDSFTKEYQYMIKDIYLKDGHLKEAIDIIYKSLDPVYEVTEAPFVFINLDFLLRNVDKIIDFSETMIEDKIYDNITEQEVDECIEYAYQKVNDIVEETIPEAIHKWVETFSSSEYKSLLSEQDVEEATDKVRNSLSLSSFYDIIENMDNAAKTNWQKLSDVGMSEKDFL